MTVEEADELGFNLAVPSIGSYLMKPSHVEAVVIFLDLAVPSIGSYLMKLIGKQNIQVSIKSCSTLYRVVPNETTIERPCPKRFRDTCSTLYRVVPNETRVSVN